MTETYLTARGGKFKTRAYAEKSIPPGYKIVESEDGFYGVKGNNMDVLCPQCGQCHHHTTDAFDPDRTASPDMLKLKEPYATWGWEPPPPDASAGYGCLVCPECGGALAPSGKLRVG